MRTGWATAACATVISLALGAPAARAQAVEEPDPCDALVGGDAQSECWTNEAERADTEMRQTLEALLARLPSRAASELRKAQKSWLEFREAHLAMLYAVDNPKNVHRTEGLICTAIARRELARARTRQLKRLLQPSADEACPL